MANVCRDLRLAIGTLSRTPGTTAVIVVTLALVIGANSAIFSLFNALVLRPLPIPQPEQLVGLLTVSSDSVNGDDALTLPMFQELSRHQDVLTDLFASNAGGVDNVEVNGRHYTVSGANVSGGYYNALRIAPVLGRFITDSDVAIDSGTSNAVAVISYRSWRSWYRGDAQVVGKTLRLDGQLFTVIGVEPAGFAGLLIDSGTDVTVPLFAPGTYSSRSPQQLWLEVHGRLRPGLSLSQARTRLDVLWPAIQRATVPPDYDAARSKRFFKRRLKVESSSHGGSFLRKRFSHPLNILLVLVGCLLLIACLNLANLSIAKMASQQHAWSVKLALGAGRWDFVRPILVESFVAAAAGSVCGLAVAYWSGPFLLHLAWTGFVETPLSTSPDLSVLMFTAGLAILTALLFSIVPAWYATRSEAAAGLRMNTRSIHQGSTILGKTLLVGQVALSLALVAGAMLFGKTLMRFHNADTGYRRDHLLTLQLFPLPGAGNWQNRTAYYRTLAEKVSSIPGVGSVSYSNDGPANQFEYRLPIFLLLESKPVQAIDEIVGPDFFRTMGMHVLTGREFGWSDDEHAPMVAVVSQKLADKLFAGLNPLGRNFYSGAGSNQRKLQIVGVVNNASLWKVDSAEQLAVYRPILQYPDTNEPLMDVRTLVEPGSLKTVAERAVRSFGYQYSLRTATLDERLDGRLTAQRLTALLAGFFGVVALLIAAIGLYGLMSFHVTQRITELAVRLALGAQSWQVFSIVLREVMSVAGLGCALGLVASVSLRSYVASVLFGVSATDPVLLGSASLILVMVAMLAGFLPARRASSVDPAVALRKE